MTTVATKEGDSVIYNGEKVYTTNGPKADIFVLMGYMIQVIRVIQWCKQ